MLFAENFFDALNKSRDLQMLLSTIFSILCQCIGSRFFCMFLLNLKTNKLHFRNITKLYTRKEKIWISKLSVLLQSLHECLLTQFFLLTSIENYLSNDWNLSKRTKIISIFINNNLKCLFASCCVCVLDSILWVFSSIHQNLLYDKIKVSFY